MEQVCNFCEQNFESKKIKKFCSQKCYFDSKKCFIINTCVMCEKEFTIAYRFRNKKTCSRNCMSQLLSKKLTTSVTKQCLVCNKNYLVTQSYKDNAKYCSYECFLLTRKTRQPDIKKVCENCNEEFNVPFTKQSQRFCGYSCANSGVNNPYFGVTGNSHPMFGKKAWNNGLTLKSDERLRTAGKKISANLKKQFSSGKLSNSGEKNPNYRNVSETLSQEKRRNFSNAAIKRILNGVSGIKTGHVSGKFHGKKSNKPVYFRSSWELAAMMMWDEDPNIVSYNYEPLVVRLSETQKTIPDFLVKFSDGSSKIIEIKPTAIQKMLSEKLNKTRAVLKDMGYEYELFGNKEFEMCKEKLGDAFLDELKRY